MYNHPFEQSTNWFCAMLHYLIASIETIDPPNKWQLIWSITGTQCPYTGFNHIMVKPIDNNLYHVYEELIIHIIFTTEWYENQIISLTRHLALVSLEKLVKLLSSTVCNLEVIHWEKNPWKTCTYSKCR